MQMEKLGARQTTISQRLLKVSLKQTRHFKVLFIEKSGNKYSGMANAIAGIPASGLWELKSKGNRTCGWRAQKTRSISAILPLMASNGLEGTSKCKRWVEKSMPSSSSRSMRSRERPSSYVSNSRSESKHSIRLRKLVQSSCNSYLQYISTRGRSSMQVARSWCRVGLLVLAWRRHTMCPAQQGSVGGLFFCSQRTLRRRDLGHEADTTCEKIKGAPEERTQFCLSECRLVHQRVRVKDVAE